MHIPFGCRSVFFNCFTSHRHSSVCVGSFEVLLPTGMHSIQRCEAMTPHHRTAARYLAYQYYDNLSSFPTPFSSQLLIIAPLFAPTTVSVSLLRPGGACESLLPNACS